MFPVERMASIQRHIAYRTGVLAGLAGGLAEIAWIVGYARLTGAEAAVVAHGITATFVSGLTVGSAAVVSAIAIHMVLAMLLGIVVMVVLERLAPSITGTVMEPFAVIAMLAGVWAVNFLIVLPAINPQFVTLLPYGVTFASKLLFGVAAALVFWVAQRQQDTAE